jgi:hypothetical protein
MRDGWRLRVILGAVLATCAVAWPAPALGHERTTLDADDSSGPLDVVLVRARHKTQTEVTTHPERSRRVTELRFRLVTYEKWNRSLLEGAKNFVALEFNLDGDNRIERCLRVRNGRHELVGRLYRGCYRRMKLVTSVSVSRPDKHTLVAAFDKDRLRKRLGSFRWRATTSFEDPDGAQGDACYPGTSPSEGPYGVCRDSTRWSPHRFR